MDLLLRGLGVVRSVLGVGGRYRAAQFVGLAVAIGWFIYTATRGDADAAALGLACCVGGRGALTVSDCDGDSDCASGARRGGAVVHCRSAVRDGAEQAERDALRSARWPFGDVFARSARPLFRFAVKR